MLHGICGLDKLLAIVRLCVWTTLVLSVVMWAFRIRLPLGYPTLDIVISVIHCLATSPTQSLYNVPLYSEYLFTCLSSCLSSVSTWECSPLPDQLSSCCITHWIMVIIMRTAQANRLTASSNTLVGGKLFYIINEPKHRSREWNHPGLSFYRTLWTRHVTGWNRRRQEMAYFSEIPDWCITPDNCIPGLRSVVILVELQFRNFLLIQYNVGHPRRNRWLILMWLEALGYKENLALGKQWTRLDQDITATLYTFSF